MRAAILLSTLAVTIGAWGQAPLGFPASVEAGTSFSVPTKGSGPASLYIAGPSHILRRKIQLGETVVLSGTDLQTAGHYVAFLLPNSNAQQADALSTQFDVTPAQRVSTVSFLAKPSRLAVSAPNGISGVSYVFDVFHNWILQPRPVSFQMTDASGHSESRSVQTHDGVAWIKMDSAPKAGIAHFDVSTGYGAEAVQEKRVVQEVPGDPCTLRMSARASGHRVALETDPVRDCSGNAVPDGTIVTFTEFHPGGQSTVDVPLKRGIARTEIPSVKGSVISVASGVVMGNEIRWGGGS
jgi:hypothetical protein